MVVIVNDNVTLLIVSINVFDVSCLFQGLTNELAIFNSFRGHLTRLFI